MSARPDPSVDLMRRVEASRTPWSPEEADPPAPPPSPTAARLWWFRLGLFAGAALTGTLLGFIG